MRQIDEQQFVLHYVDFSAISYENEGLLISFLCILIQWLQLVCGIVLYDWYCKCIALVPAKQEFMFLQLKWPTRKRVWQIQQATVINPMKAGCFTKGWPFHNQ